MAEGNSPSAEYKAEYSLGNEHTYSEDGIDLTLIRCMLSLTAR